MLTLLLAACAHDPAPDAPGTTGGDSDPVTTTPPALDPDALDELRARVDRDFRNLLASGASVALWQHGDIVFAEGFGSADPDVEVPVTPDTLFQVGSDTKKMTAIAVLQQVEAGTLDLDDPLEQVLPDVELAANPEWNNTATLHQLLSQQGGLVDYTPWEDDPGDEVLAGRAAGVFSEEGWAMAPAGAFWNYANPNFSLAGLAAERAAGMPYADLLVERVIGPLGMDHTYARETDIAPDEAVAVGYGYWYTGERDWFDPFDDATYDAGRADRDRVIDNGFVRPAGMVWSTAPDMCRLAGFLMEGDPAVLGDTSRAAITTPYVNLVPSDPHDGYGYGVFVSDTYPDVHGNLHDAPFWFHGGNTLAYTSTFYMVPEQDFAVCILSNGYGDDFSRSAHTAIDLFAGVPSDTLTRDDPPYTVDPATHAGHYVDRAVGGIDITWHEDHLEIAMPDFEARGFHVDPVLTQTVNEVYSFTVEGGGAFEISFIDGQDGTPSRYLRHRYFVGVRTD